MKKHLFITGPIQVGKSTMLMEALAPYREYVGGFVSQRLIDDNGNTRGFRLADYDESPSLRAPFDPSLPDIFLRLGDNITSDLSIFETKGIEIIRKTKETKKILLLDEIGGIELRSRVFTEALYDALDSMSCIGVLKGSSSAGNTIGELAKERIRLLDYLSECDTIEIGCGRKGDEIDRIHKYIEESMEYDI